MQSFHFTKKKKWNTSHLIEKNHLGIRWTWISITDQFKSVPFLDKCSTLFYFFPGRRSFYLARLHISVSRIPSRIVQENVVKPLHHISSFQCTIDVYIEIRFVARKSRQPSVLPMGSLGYLPSLIMGGPFPFLLSMEMYIKD